MKNHFRFTAHAQAAMAITWIALSVALSPISVLGVQVAPPVLPEPDKAVANAMESVLGGFYNYRTRWPARPRYPCLAALGQDCFGPDIDGGCSPYGTRARCRTEEEMAALADRLVGLTEEFPESALPLLHGVYATMKFGYLDHAAELVRECAPSVEWWCEFAAGYVFHRSGFSDESESHLRLALQTMPDSLRCGLENIEPLLPEALHTEYVDLPCSARSKIHEWFWWLADPFLVEAGNGRWAEHLARGFEFMLNHDLANWVRSPIHLHSHENHIRRGFPDSRDVYHRSVGTNRVRVTTVNWRSLAGAFNHFVPEGFSFHELNDGLSYKLEADIPFHPLVFGTGDEGYTRATGFVLPIPVQLARFREGDSLEVALASEPGAAGIETSGEAFFVASEGPEHVVTLDPAPLRERVVFQARLANRQQLVGMEVFTPGTDGRHRQVLQPLDTSERLLSDLLLFRPLDTDLPETRLGAVALMYGSPRTLRNRELGVYWETYGLTPGEDLRISVHLERVGEGLVSRALGAVGIGDQERGTVTWSETVAESGPFLSAIILNLSGVDAGSYDLVVDLQPGDGALLTRRKRFEVAEGSDQGDL